MLNIIIASGVICIVYIVISLLVGSRQMSLKKQLIWLGSLVLGTFLVGQGIFGLGNLINRENTLAGFHQYLNGTIVDAVRQDISCKRDGDCTYTYTCDEETETTVTIGSDGNVKTDTKTITHDCPYATYEFRYSATDSFGSNIGFGTTISTEPNGWRDGVAIPDNLPRGAPAQWQIARTALDQGIGVPVTKDSEYKNYVLASDSNAYAAPSGVVDALLEAKLLPDIEQSFYGTFNIDKVNFVGNYNPTNQDEWQAELMQLNAALGTEHGGDLRIVILRSSDIPDNIKPDDYIAALKSYWTHDQGKYALAKNAVVVVIALREGNHNVDWMRAETGMPAGNETLIKTINYSFSGQDFSLEAILGQTRATVKDSVATYTYGQGSLAQAMLVTAPFEQVCMENCGEAAGYDHLRVNPELDFWGHFLVILFTALLSSIGWATYLYYCREESSYY